MTVNLAETTKATQVVHQTVAFVGLKIEMPLGMFLAAAKIVLICASRNLPHFPPRLRPRPRHHPPPTRDRVHPEQSLAF
jgi:hypothetical protein